MRSGRRVQLSAVVGFSVGSAGSAVSLRTASLCPGLSSGSVGWHSVRSVSARPNFLLYFAIVAAVVVVAVAGPQSPVAAGPLF